MNPDEFETETDRDIIYSLKQSVLRFKLHVKKEVITVRVLISGSLNPQFIAFNQAADIASKKFGSADEIIYECLDCENLRKFKEPKDLVDWIVESDVHFILGHIHQGENILILIEFYLFYLLLYFLIHQGVIEQTEWSVTELYEELGRLWYHLGWPSGPKLRCPILTQHKINYHKVCSLITNPTLEVPMKALTKREATKEEYDEWYCFACRLYVNPNFDNCQECNTPKRKVKGKKKRKNENNKQTNRNIKYRIVESHSNEEKANITNFCLTNSEGILYTII